MLEIRFIRLDASFYRQNAATVARRLLGTCLFVQASDGLRAGWIVETEAYLHRDDPACHANRGMTRSNATMFGRGGLLYVYSIHAKFCMNVVTGSEGSGQAVLLRAIEPIVGIESMRQATSRSDLVMLAKGPGRLCQSLSIDRTWDGLDLATDDRIWIGRTLKPHRPKLAITAASRIGISAGQDLMLRYFVDGNRFVSGLVRTHSVRPVHSMPKHQILDSFLDGMD
jgi:DNA-3-methyladenine glycosylase